MASNYVDTAVEEGRFHGHGTTPTGAASSSSKTMRRSWSSSHGGHKCVCAPPTHPRSFKCRLHRNGSHGHHGRPASPPSPATDASSSPSSTRTLGA